MAVDRLHELLAAVVARCEARAAAARASGRGPLCVTLDALPLLGPDTDSGLPGGAPLLHATTGFGPARRAVRVNWDEDAPDEEAEFYGRQKWTDWPVEIVKQARRYGHVWLSGGVSEDVDCGIAYMLTLSEGGLFEHDQGRDDPYGGSNTWNLLDYGWLADEASLRHCAPDCSQEHYYELGHVLYRRAVSVYGALDKRAVRLECFAAPMPATRTDLARAWARRKLVRDTRHDAGSREMLRRARAECPAQGSEARPVPA